MLTALGADRVLAMNRRSRCLCPIHVVRYHASTGPMPAYIWSNMTEFKEKTAIACAASKISGYTEPIDVNEKVTLLD